MRENLSIAFLLITTTVLASVLIIFAYRQSWPYKEAHRSVSFDMAEEQAEAPLPSPTPEYTRPTPTAAAAKTERKHAPTGAVEITAVSEPPEAIATPTPVPAGSAAMGVIVDLDYNSDVDDVAALRIATSLAKLGRIELRAVMASTAGDKVCKAIHAHLRYDGFGSVPIGASMGETIAGSPYWDDMIKAHFSAADYSVSDSLSLYKAVLRDCGVRAAAKKNNAAARKAEAEAEKQAALAQLEDAGEGNTSGNHQRTMEEKKKREDAEKAAAAAGEKIRIITTGYLINVAALLQDPEGYALVSQYVDSIWITGGIYEQGADYNFDYTEEAALAANYVSLHSPVPLVYSSSASVEDDEGNVIVCGGSIMNAEGAAADPVVIAFTAYGRDNKVSLKGGRIAWDPFCVWAACLPAEETQVHLQAINIAVSAGGWNKFSESLTPNCQYIRRNSDELGWYVGQLDMIINMGLH